MLASLFCGLARKQYLEELSGIAQLLGFDANMVAGVIVEAGETSAAPFKPPHGPIEYARHAAVIRDKSSGRTTSWESPVVVNELSQSGL
jgi:hypothetical protein